MIRFTLRSIIFVVLVILTVSCGGGGGNSVIPPVDDFGDFRYISKIQTLCSEDIVVGNGYLYIADGPAGLLIADISNLQSPSIVNRIASTYAIRLEIYRNHLYLCDGPAGIKVYSLQNPSSPTLTFSEDTEWATSVAFDKNLMILGDYFGGLRVYNTENPASPSLIKVSPVSRVRDVAFHENNLMVSDAPFGLATYSIKDPSSLFCAYTDASRFANFEDIVSVGDYVIVSQNDEASRLSVLRVKGLVSVQNKGDYYPARFIDGITAHSDHVVASCGEDGVVCYSTIDMPNLTESFRINTPGYTRRAKIVDDYLFVADMSGVLIFKLGEKGTTTPPPVIHETHPIPNGILPAYQNRSLVYGDVHVHSNISDGDESPDFALRYARDVSKLDFCVLTDHSNHIVDDGYKGLDYYRSMPGKYDDPGDFCVLYGYEWSSLLSGHRCVYTLDNKIPILSQNDSNYAEIGKLWNTLAGYDYFTACHHTMIKSQNNWWKYKNKDIEPLVEIYSKWGLSLREESERPIINNNPANGIFRAMIGEGTRYGFIAGSDTHMSRPGSVLEESRQSPALHYAQPGITAVWTKEFTREAIFDAMRKRQCYGMTGTRVNIEYTVNGAIMGSEIRASIPPQIEFRVSSDVEIAIVSLFRITNERVDAYKTYYVNAKEFSGTDINPWFLGGEGYSIKVILSNGDFAMASPVWVDKL